MNQDRIRLGDLATRFTPRAELPTKLRGRHRWIAVASFAIPAPESVVMCRELTARILVRDTALSIGIACYDCEQPWAEDIGPCPAPAAD